jgi:hypothetical protein
MPSLLTFPREWVPLGSFPGNTSNHCIRNPLVFKRNKNSSELFYVNAARLRLKINHSSKRFASVKRLHLKLKRLNG